MSNFFASYLTPTSTTNACDAPAVAFTSAPSAFLKVESGAHGTSSATSPLMVASPLLAAVSAAAGALSSSVASSGSSFSSSFSASSTPICIDTNGQVAAAAAVNAMHAAVTQRAAATAAGTDIDATTSAAGSVVSSFPTKLSSLYVGNLPEGLLFPFLCQQQQLQQQQQQQAIQYQQQPQLTLSGLSKDDGNSFGLNAQSIATTMQSLLGGQPLSTSAQPSVASTILSTTDNSTTSTPAAASNAVDVDMNEEKSTEQLTSQMQFAFRNHFGTTRPTETTMKVSDASSTAVSSQAGISLDQTSSFQIGSFSNRMLENRSQGHATTSSRTTSESSNAAEENVVAPGVTATAATVSIAQANASDAGSTPTTVAAAFAAVTGAGSSLLMRSLPAVEHLRHEALSCQRSAIERSGSPLKMRSRLNSRNKGVERSTTPPNSQGIADDDQSNICNVCGDEASGRHYGASTCFGCKGFFRRTVRANKTYSCRYEERCEIDKIGRNTCRSCRFRKCLNVGMEPDAIRPDRDKTGRQKNPRRQSIALPTNPMSAEATAATAAAIRTAASLPSSHESGALAQQLIDDETTLNVVDVSASGAADRLRYPIAGGRDEDSLAAEAMVAERDLIIDTLLEIERICSNLRDVPQHHQQQYGVESTNNNNDEDACERTGACVCASNADGAIFAGELSQVIARPSLISTRTQLEFTGDRGAIQQAGGDANCCGRRHFYRAFRRMLTLSIDFTNTLKPIADISLQQRENLVRSCIASYIVFLSAFRTVASGRSNCILLPDGRYIDAHTSLSAFVDTRELRADVADALQSKIRFICKSIIDSVQSKMKKLNMSEVEFACLKAIITLDPAVPAIDPDVAHLLSVARDSVQNALFLHLMERQSSSQQAVFRFGQLLMMISNVSKIGAFLYNVMEMVTSVGGELADTATLRLFIGLDRICIARKATDGIGIRPPTSPLRKVEKMSDDSDENDDDDDEMDEMDANE